MTEVYKLMYNSRTLRHVPLLVRLSSRYKKLETTMPLTCERDRWGTVQRPTQVLKVLDIISTTLHNFVRLFCVLCMRHMMRTHIPSNYIKCTS